jgi:hypothetical protein
MVHHIAAVDKPSSFGAELCLPCARIRLRVYACACCAPWMHDWSALGACGAGLSSSLREPISLAHAYMSINNCQIFIVARNMFLLCI